MFDTKLIKRDRINDEFKLITNQKIISTKNVIYCCGLYSDQFQKNSEFKIIPFRGEYYEIDSNKNHLFNSLIYPVPDPNFPFLGVHLTKTIHGKLEAGPNAVLAFAKEGYRKRDINLEELKGYIFYPGFREIVKKYWKTGSEEMLTSFSKTIFLNKIQNLVPSIERKDLISKFSGVRAQACTSQGELIDDFYFKKNENEIFVYNAPSPAATSSLSIGGYIADLFFSKY